MKYHSLSGTFKNLWIPTVLPIGSHSLEFGSLLYGIGLVVHLSGHREVLQDISYLIALLMFSNKKQQKMKFNTEITGPSIAKMVPRVRLHVHKFTVLSFRSLEYRCLPPAWGPMGDSTNKAVRQRQFLNKFSFCRHLDWCPMNYSLKVVNALTQILSFN